MKAVYRTLALLAATSLVCLPAAAEELMLDAIAKDPPNSPSGLLRPATGMTMTTVSGQFGEPEQRLAPVGTPGSRHQPPITRWVYPGYTVYFENERVITSVVNR